MTPINNSDTAWLIVSDYNQDNDLFHEDLREDVLNPEIDQWRYEYRIDYGVGGIHEGRWVGSDVIGGREVGNNQCWQVGSRFDSDIGVYPSHLVGGHTY
jgi:hypothetical protein